MGNSSNSSQLQDGWDPNTCFLVQREVTSHRSPTPSYHLHTQEHAGSTGKPSGWQLERCRA